MKKFIVGNMVEYLSRILYSIFPGKNLIENCNWKYLCVFQKHGVPENNSYSLKNREGAP